MKKTLLLISSLFALSVSWNTGAQVLSLDKAIRLAQDSAILAYQSKNAMLRSQWEYEQFLSTRRPQLSFVLEPGYQKFSFEPGLSYLKMRNYNMLNTLGSLKVEQQALGIGGQFYAGTSLLWTEYFNSDQNRAFSTIPISVGYANEMIGYNNHKWERQIQDFHMESEKKAYLYSLSKIASEAEGYYLDYVIAASICDIYNSNATTFLKMYEIGKEKFEMASISKNELCALELQYVNAENTLYSALQDKENARESLLSYLRIDDDGQQFEVMVPEVEKFINIDVEEAIAKAKENNPDFRDKEEDILAAKQRSDKARVQASIVQSALDLNLGMQSSNGTFSTAYNNQNFFFFGGITLRIPIFDGGLAKSRKKAAEYNLQEAESAQQESERKLELAVSLALKEFNTQQNLIRRTKKVLELADESFELARSLYGDGETDINTFMLAQTRKDEAHTNYLKSLRLYWNSYYKLQEICVYNFLQ